MRVARWLAFVLSVLVFAAGAGCSSLLGDFTVETNEVDGGGGGPGVDSSAPPADANGAVDGTMPSDSNAPPVDTGSDAPIVPPTDSGNDSAVPCPTNSACSVPNAEGICVANLCAIVQCLNGYTDCNGTASDGCEVHTASDPTNCGSCKHGCDADGGTPICTGGSCTGITCDPGRADCNNNPTDGCEINTNGDPTNCGTCSHLCGTANTSAVSCNEADDAGVPQCGFTCTGTFQHCGSSADKNGCDVNTNSDNNNCGGCGIVCGNGQTCSNGSCACDATHCATGCCESTQDGGSTCTSETTSVCGVAGKTCATCDPDAGLECNQTTGSCVCDATSCPNGCCDGNVCVTTSSDQQCLKGGVTCKDCTNNGASGLACSGDGTQCVCTQASCGKVNGCCQLPAADAGASATATCLTGGAQSPTACGSGGNNCGECASGQACTQGATGGTCNCGGGLCAGCCSNGTCVTTSTQAQANLQCGKSGASCINCTSSGNKECNSQGQCVCDANTCPSGCCDASGVCQTGEGPSTCGSGGSACAPTCASGQECANTGTPTAPNYQCTCDATSCSKGCCQNNQCIPYASQPAANTCGSGGAQCGGCGPGLHCNNAGACVCDGTTCGGCCGTNAQNQPVCNNSGPGSCGVHGAGCQVCATSQSAAGGQECNANGQCVCDSTSCGHGCCSATVNGACQLGTSNGACGNSGNLCGGCPNGSGTDCVATTSGGQCQCDNTCAGCCSTLTTCAAGNAPTSCGSGGHSCINCLQTGETCGATTDSCVCSGCIDGSGVCHANGSNNPATNTPFCGVGGVSCTTCSGATECTGTGVCTCDINTCANGCCSALNTNGAQCITAQSTSSCGNKGALCAPCGNGQGCDNNACTCDSHCAGCCDNNNTCETLGTNTCGINGNSCKGCGLGQACSGPGTPNAGQCVCTPGCTGCCAGGTLGSCVGGTVQGACGSGGATCATCASSIDCANNGTSAAPNYQCTCDATYCTGCCQGTVSGTCLALGSENVNSCAPSGGQCSPCNATTSNGCSSTGCTCAGGASCSGTQTCCSSGCSNLQTDPNNCGSCGHSCGAGGACGVIAPGAIGCLPTEILNFNQNVDDYYGLTVTSATPPNNNLFVTSATGPYQVWAGSKTTAPIGNGNLQNIYYDTTNGGAAGLVDDPLAPGGDRLWYSTCPIIGGFKAPDGGTASAEIFLVPPGGAPANGLSPTFTANGACVPLVFADTKAVLWWNAFSFSGNATIQGWLRTNPISDVQTFYPSASIVIAAVDSGNVYFVLSTASVGGTFFRQDIPDLFAMPAGTLPGSGNGTTFMSGNPGQAVMAFDSTYVYYWDSKLAVSTDGGAGNGAIARQLKTGSPTSTVMAAAASQPFYILVDSTYLYWTSGALIERIPLSQPGSAPTTLFTGDAGQQLRAFTQDSTSLYWTACGQSGDGGTGSVPGCSIWRMAK